MAVVVTKTTHKVAAVMMNNIHNVHRVAVTRTNTHRHIHIHERGSGCDDHTDNTQGAQGGGDDDDNNDNTQRRWLWS